MLVRRDLMGKRGKPTQPSMSVFRSGKVLKEIYQRGATTARDLPTWLRVGSLAQECYASLSGADYGLHPATAPSGGILRIETFSERDRSESVDLSIVREVAD